MGCENEAILLVILDRINTSEVRQSVTQILENMCHKFPLVIWGRRRAGCFSNRGHFLCWRLRWGPTSNGEFTEDVRAKAQGFRCGDNFGVRFNSFRNHQPTASPIVLCWSILHRRAREISPFGHLRIHKGSAAPHSSQCQPRERPLRLDLVHARRQKQHVLVNPEHGRDEEVIKSSAKYICEWGSSSRILCVQYDDHRGLLKLPIL
jgi:hypothetical protein